MQVSVEEGTDLEQKVHKGMRVRAFREPSRDRSKWNKSWMKFSEGLAGAFSPA